MVPLSGGVVVVFLAVGEPPGLVRAVRLELD